MKHGGVVDVGFYAFVGFADGGAGEGAFGLGHVGHGGGDGEVCKWEDGGGAW